VINKNPVIRRCISCKQNFDRDSLIKVTKDHNLGFLINEGMGRSAYICKRQKCVSDSKIKKRIQKALKAHIDPKFYEIFEMEIQNYK
tara:strand:- start:114 stop:374 length:261 start_codon:yes stop_codon:yes gene_type:complete